MDKSEEEISKERSDEIKEMNDRIEELLEDNKFLERELIWESDANLDELSSICLRKIRRVHNFIQVNITEVNHLQISDLDNLLTPEERRLQ